MDDRSTHRTYNPKGIHPAPAEFSDAQLSADPVLRYFHYSHLPQPLQDISSAFCTLAAFMVEALPRNPERTVALRKLLEAKDAGVRANVGELQPRPAETFYDRLLAERKELADRLEKLRGFIGDDFKFSQLPEHQRVLLNDQADAMTNYVDILNERIDAIEPVDHVDNTLDLAGFEIEGDVKITGGDQSEEAIPFKG